MVNGIKRILGLSLRKKILAFSILVFLCIVIFSYVLTMTIVKDRFSRLESTYTILSVNRALHALNDDIYYLKTTGIDWAMWDDTYAFVETPAQSYIEANLPDEMLIQLGLNFIVLADSSGQIVFAKALDLAEKNQIPLPIKGRLTPDSLLLQHTGLDSVISGILLLPDNPMLVASHPILTSQGEGPIRGTLIMGRYLDAAEIKSLEDRVQIPMTIQPISAMMLPDGFWEKVEASSEESSAIVQPLDKDTVAGYVIIRDIYNEPSLVLRVTLPRDIYQEGLKSAALLSLIIVALITIGLLAVFGIIDRQVLRRLVQIDNTVKSIGTTEELSLASYSLVGHDELTRLAVSINDMLARLNDTKNKLQQSEKVYRELFEESRQQYEGEKELRQRLEEEIEKRAEFTRALVHELKTPITPVLAALDLLREEIHDARLLQLVQSMDRSASNLNKRIDELLDLARAETNRLEINIVAVDIRTLLQQVGQTMGTMASQNGQTMVFDLPAYLPMVEADDERLRQVVANLLTNALKFTPAGGMVTLRAKQEDDKVCVEIQDTGPGISEEDQKRLFEPYHRRIGDRERLSGLGLGLALAKKFVELQGGEIWVNSQPGKGSTFGFSLPSRNLSRENKKELPGEQS